MKLKILPLGLALLALSQLLISAQANQVPYLKQGGGYDWDYFDIEIRKISSLFGYKDDQFDTAKLVHRQHKGKDVKFIYDSGNKKGDEVTFKIVDQGSISLKEWRKATLDEIMPPKQKKIKKPNDIPSVPISLATPKDYQPQKFLKKVKECNKYQSLKPDQIKNDRRFAQVKKHIQKSADIILSKAKLIDVYRKQDDQDSFTYKCVFNAVKKSQPSKGVLRAVIIVSIDQDADDQPDIVEQQFFKLDIVPINEKNTQGAKGKQQEQLQSVQRKQDLMISRHFPYKLGQQIIKKQIQAGNGNLSNTQSQKGGQKDNDKFDLKVAKQPQQKVSQKQVTQKIQKRFMEINAEQGICLINKSNGDCQKCSHRSIPVGKKCFKVQDQCIQFDQQNGECFKCYSGYYLSKGVCKKNQPLCAESDSNGNCIECFKNYQLIDGKCVSLSNQTNKEIRKADPLCIKTWNGKCQQCVAGAYLNKAKICKIADPNCQRFDQDTQKCKFCLRGYQLQNGKCERLQKKW